MTVIWLAMQLAFQLVPEVIIGIRSVGVKLNDPFEMRLKSAQASSCAKDSSEDVQGSGEDAFWAPPVENLPRTASWNQAPG